MNESTFWEIIESSNKKDLYNICPTIVEKLSKLSDNDIYLFEIILQQKMKEICTWDAFGCLLVLETVTDDEGFSDFRCYIISKGKEFFDLFSKNGAESLANELLKDYGQYGYLRLESLSYVATKALEEKYESKNFKNPIGNAYENNFSKGSTVNLKGEELYESMLPNKFPTLWIYQVEKMRSFGLGD